MRLFDEFFYQIPYWQTDKILANGTTDGVVNFFAIFLAIESRTNWLYDDKLEAIDGYHQGTTDSLYCIDFQLDRKIFFLPSFGVAITQIVVDYDDLIVSTCNP